MRACAILFSLMLQVLANSALLDADFKTSQIKLNQGVLNSFGLDLKFLPALNISAFTYLDFPNRWEELLKSFERGQEVIPTLRLMLLEGGVPQEFLFLAMAESGFSSRAYSRKKASGIWQLMPQTAKELGLKINAYIDERRDPIKSTKAAIKYLQYLKKTTGEWYLAAMAYNCGLGRLKRAIKEAQSTDLEVLIDPKKAYLPQETRQYIRMILGMSLAFHNVDALKRQNQEYLLNRGATNTIMGVKVPAGVHLAEIAQSVGMSLKELKKYNQQFLYNFLPPGKGNYVVYLPYAKIATFKQEFKGAKNPNEMFILHRVQEGESLYTIARKYKITMQELRFVNDVQGSHIRINQTLIVPVLKDENKRIAQKQ